MMGKRDDFDDFFGDDHETPVVDTRADGRLYRVPLGRLAPNLVNPRNDFGTKDQLLDLGKSLARRQIQACPAVSRGAYLKLWPDHAEQIGEVDYVLVSGERRFRGATEAGVPGLNCVVDDDLARDRRTFMEAVVSENVDRQNFDPIEEAYAVQSLVREFGSNRAVAQHFDRVDGWVTQRVLLTNLDPTMHDLVRKREMPLEAARKLGKLARDNAWDAGQQAAWWEQEQERRAAATQARAAAKRAPARDSEPPPHLEAAMAAPASSEPPGFTAVKPDPPAAPSALAVPAYASGAEESFTAVKQEPSAAEPAGPVQETPLVRPEERRVPEPRPQEQPVPVSMPAHEAEPDPEVRRTVMPWTDGEACAEIVIAKMSPGERGKLVQRLLEKEREEQERQQAAARAN